MQNAIVSREDWLQARIALMAKEKALTRARDHLSAEQRALPWFKIEKEYVFEGPAGTVTLAELFDGRSQLVISHFMMPPGAPHQCVGCSLGVDQLEGALPHLEAHDLALVVIARAPIAEIEAVRRRMGWRCRWASSYHSDFNYDFNVSFTPEQIAAGTANYNFRNMDPGLEDLSGTTILFKDEAGQIFQTYSVFSRGEEDFMGIYRLLDVTPMGRNENGPYHSMADWARPRDMYGKGGMVEGNGRFHLTECGCAEPG